MENDNTMVKVAHLIGSLKVGGAERFIIDLCKAQKGLGLKPTIVSLGGSKDILFSICQHNHIPVISYSGQPFIKLCRVFFTLLNFDVIHVHSPHTLKYIQFFLPFLNANVIYTRHGAAPLSACHWKKLHLKAKKYIKSIIFVSQEGKDNFQETHSWQEVPNRVIDNGVIINSISKPAQQTTLLRIGSVGRMIPLKNQLGLLKAINRLDKQGQESIDLHFFGDGECNEALTEYAVEKLAAVDVTFHGMVSDREKIYSSFDVLVVCSKTEGLSMVIIEAMANKIPVIATNVGGNPKLVINDKTGWLFEYDDEEKLTEIITRVMKNKQLITETGEHAFSYIRENFSIESSAKKYNEIYASTVGS